MTFNRTYSPSGSQGDYPGLAAKPGRLQVSRQSGLAVMDTSNGAELYYDNPFVGWSNLSFLKLSPDGNTMYLLNTGLSPASIYVLDVSEDTPRYIAEECCHTCLGSGGKGLELSTDGALAFVAVGARTKVLSTVPLLQEKFVGLTDSSPTAVAVSADGNFAYLGYRDPEFAVVRTSDWLTFHVGDLQGDVADGGLALSSSQTTLAAVIEFAGFDPNRIELINVGNPTANRGGIRVHPMDSEHPVPIVDARISGPFSEGDSGYVDVAAGAVGRTPVEPDTYEVDITAPGYPTTVVQNVTVTAGQWTDLGTITMTRAGGAMNGIQKLCASPAAEIGRTVEVNVTGIGFFPGDDLLVRSFDPKITVDDFTYQDWSTITATVTVAPDAEPGLSYNDLQVVNPDGNSDSGNMLRMPLNPMVFDDGFESGDLSNWSSVVP